MSPRRRRASRRQRRPPHARRRRAAPAGPPPQAAPSLPPARAPVLHTPAPRSRAPPSPKMVRGTRRRRAPRRTPPRRTRRGRFDERGTAPRPLTRNRWHSLISSAVSIEPLSSGGPRRLMKRRLSIPPPATMMIMRCGRAPAYPDLLHMTRPWPPPRTPAPVHRAPRGLYSAAPAAAPLWNLTRPPALLTPPTPSRRPSSSGPARILKKRAPAGWRRFSLHEGATRRVQVRATPGPVVKIYRSRARPVLTERRRLENHTTPGRRARHGVATSKLESLRVSFPV
mmetsp:Transcript_11038/g.32647  ORF Transcript_11038/g.32647 Transcript_11038/m.32647 type:complete len:283 (+) Transcript_11038:182-1030(+)